MFKVYNDIKDDKQNVIQGLTKLFIEETDDTGTILNYLNGPLIVPERSGTLLIVDEWLIDQLDKVIFLDGVLSVKDGEELVPPVKTEKELQIEAIERQLAALKAEPDEPVGIEVDTELPVEETAVTEKSTENVFNEYDEIINDDFRQQPSE